MLLYSMREMIKRVDAYAIFSIPADIDEAALPAITAQLCEFIVSNNVPGISFDMNNLHSMDRALCHALIQMMLAAGALGAAVNTTGICPGIASTLALMDSDTKNIKAFGTLDRCLADLKNQGIKYQSHNTTPCQPPL